MAQATLVGPDVNEGVEALSILDAANIPITVALLAIFPEYGDWRFVLSSSHLEVIGLFKAYHLLAETIGGRFVDTLPSMLILPMKDPFIRELRKMFGKTKDVAGMRLGGQTIGNRFLEAGYVFRVR